MKAIKLPYLATEDFSLLLRQYSNVVRYSYNRLIESKSEKDIRLLTKSLNNVDRLNSWMIQCGIKDAKAIRTRFKDEKVVFGGKPNFIKRTKNKLSKSDYKLKRLIPINIQGEELQRGNRLFNLDILENNQIIFKLNKSKHIELKLPRLRKNIQMELFKLQELNEVKSGHKGHTYSVRLTQRKNKNLWKRELLISNLGKRLGVLGIGLNKVNPAYSSFIGNLQHDYSDAVNASIEIARRGFEHKIRKNKTGFYPSLLVKHQWKEMATKFSDWKKFYLEIKNLKLKYRVPLEDASHPFSGFKQNSSYKSMVLNYVFY